MVMLVMTLLVALALVLFLSKRSRETGLILALTLALALHWMTVLVYIAKKGGIASDMQTLLYGVHGVRHALQYMLVSLRQLGYAMAVGRYLFPMLLMFLALHYSFDPLIRSRRWLYTAGGFLPCVSLVVYWPDVFEALIALHPGMLKFLVDATQVWIIAYLLIVAALLVHEYRSTTIAFYRRQFGNRCMMIGSLAVLYTLYCPQDPAQVYLFYRNEYMGAVQGLWYLSPALSMVNYVLVIAAVLICSGIGFRTLMVYAQDNLREGQEDVAIQRKFDAASKGASVFVHSVKNQLLANRVLLKRMDAELSKEEIDPDKLRQYHASLSAANAMMLGRMEELYNGIKSNTITLVPTPLEEVCRAAAERFARKYPEAKLDVQIAQDVQILCDRVHMAEAVYNLLTNGWEAQVAAGRESEPVKVMLHQERLWTVLEIRDRGNGISADQKKQIFDPFYSSKNSNYNWGMGLYYVRAIVKSHLGVLRVDSSLGRGSSFFLQLPRYASTKDSMLQANAIKEKRHEA